MKTSISNFLENPSENSDKFFNFYDWFCKDTSLERRMNSMVPKIKFLVKEGILNADTCYIWFKNSCPCQGSLYDDFRISKLDEDKTYLGGFCPRTGHNVEDKCSVWYYDTEGEFKTINFKDWNTFKKEIKNDIDLRQILTGAFRS